jgi:site-specific recombinase XerD
VLRSAPNRPGKPYSEQTVGAYLDAVASLCRWLDASAYAGGFDVLTVEQINRYLSDNLRGDTLGGTVTKQGNLRVFFKHLAEEYGTVDLW